MQATAAALTHTAEGTTERATTVAAASEETSANVQTVASATEELTASAAEIGREAHNSAKIADVDAFVKAYCLNKDVALATLNAAKAPAAVVNKADARPPSFTAPGSGQALNRADFNKALAALPAGQRQAYFDNNIKNVAD
jgi:hypothetical protein